MVFFFEDGLCTIAWCQCWRRFSAKKLDETYCKHCRDMKTFPLTVSVPFLLGLGLILRLMLILYGEWQDRVMAVKYTDVDYVVFTDAARYVWEGQSPYERATYRYTPLLAWLLTPNIWLHPVFGKFLFCFFDLLSGILICRIMSRQDASKLLTAASLILWLFNPLTLVVSSRGNAESIMSFLVLATLDQFQCGRRMVSAMLWALSVHFKIYPITYALPLYLTMSKSPVASLRRRNLASVRRPRWQRNIQDFLTACLPNKERISFFIVSLFVILLLSFGCYYCYGWVFLHETYLYHLTRSDTRHNFSPFFYMLYLTSDWTHLQRYLSLIAFIPQAGLLVAVAIKYHDDLLFSCFLQTFIFVSFNKVCTSQYFLWYLTLLPVILPSIQMSVSRACSLTFAWFCGQAIWLYFAYMLEFQGQNTFLHIWLASLLFFGINLVILMFVIKSYFSRTLSVKTR